MALLGIFVDRHFRNQKDQRVVMFPGARLSGRGYAVKSESQESNLRSFLGLFYCGQLAILVLGSFLATGWASEIYNGLGEPAEHIVRAMAISMGFYLTMVGIPEFLFFRAFKKAIPSVVSPQDEVTVTGGVAKEQIYLVAALGVIAILVLAVCILFIRAK